jgi:trigger factor
VKATIEPVEGNKVKLSIEVDEDEFESDIEAAWKRVAKQVRMKGFRPGKAPRKLLERQLGVGVGREEALREGLPTYYARAVTENDVDAIAAPSIDITSGHEEGPVVFDAVVEIRPTVEVSGYAELTVTIPSPVATDEEIDAQIERLRQQFGELATAERAVQDGDYVTIDIEGTLDDEPVEGLTAEDYLFEVGRGAVVAEIDEHLRGASTGDVLEFDAPHPDPDEDGDLHFRIVVKEVKEKVLPELDDEFANEASEFDTLAELRADIAQRSGFVRKAQALMALQDAVAAAVAELVTDDIPEALIAHEMEHRIQDFAMRLSTQGIELAQWFEMTGTSQEDFLAQLKETADRAARTDLALRAIAAAEAIEPTDEDVEEEYARLAERHELSIDEVRDQFERNDAIRGLRSEMRIRKALEWVAEQVALVDDEGNPIDREALAFPEQDADGDTATTETTTENEDDE